MSEEIARLHASVGADITGFTKGLDQAKSMLTGFGKDIGTSISGIGATLTGLTAPLTAFGLTGLHAASNFDTAMAEISARTGAVGKDLEQIREFALKMGADTTFSAQQAAEGFLQLLASGQTAKDAIATLPAVMDAAAASGEGLGRTADMVTDIMAAFQLPVSEAANVVNSLSKAAGASSADISSLGQGFGNVAGVARKFGLTVDDTAAVLAILSENGVKGAEAGTALRSMLNHMAQDTDAVKEAWSTLGTSLFDATGNMRPLKDVMEEIKISMSGMTEEQQVKIMHDLVGTYGQLGLTALTSSISIDEMKLRMKDSAKASDVAAKRMNTFSGKVESLKGSIEALQIKAITPLMDKALAPMVGQLTEIVNKVGAWVTANPVLAENITKVLAVVTSLGPALFIAGKFIGILGAGIAALASPVGLAVAGIGGLIAVLTNAGGIRDKMGEIVASIGSWISENAPKVITGFQNILGSVGDWLSDGGFAKIANGLHNVMNAAKDWIINTGWPTFKVGVETLWTNFVDFLNSDGVQRFKTGLVTLFNNAKTWIEIQGIPIFKNSMAMVVSGVVTYLTGDGANSLEGGIGRSFGEMVTWIRTEGAAQFVKAFQFVLSKVTEVLSGLRTIVADAIRKGLSESLNIPMPNTNGTVPNIPIGIPGMGNSIIEWVVGQTLSNHRLTQGTGKKIKGGRAITPFASGGFAPIGTRFMAGEAGPELGIVGPSGTTFKPMYGGGGAGGGSSNVTIYVMDRDLEARLESILERELSN